MYYNDILLCYDSISYNKVKPAYVNKFKKI